MADKKWSRKESNKLIIHIEPLFYITGEINLSKGTLNITFYEEESGYFSFNMFIYITKGDYIKNTSRVSSFSEIQELVHLYPYGWGSDKTYDYNLKDGLNIQKTISSGDKYYINMLCQVHPSKGYPHNNYHYAWCDIAMDGVTENPYHDEALEDCNDHDWRGYLNGTLNPGGKAAFSRWDPTANSVKPYTQLQSLMPEENDQFDEYYTAVAFVIEPDEESYLGGRLVISATRNSSYTNITATATYTKNTAPYFYGVQGESNVGSHKGQIKIVLAHYTNEAHTSSDVVSTQYITPSANGKVYTASYIFTPVTDSEDYFVTAYLYEDIGSAGYNKLEANEDSDGKAITLYAPGSSTVTASRSGEYITAKGTYTKGSETGKEPATRYWGSKTTGGTSDSNKSKVLLVLKNNAGTELESGLASNKTNYTFSTKVESNKSYTVECYVIEYLDTKTVVPKSTATVNALDAIGTVSITGSSRTDTTATLSAAYHAGGTPFYGTLNKTDKKKLYYFLRIYDGDPNSYEKDLHVDSYGTWVQRKKIACSGTFGTDTNFQGANWVVEGLDPYTSYEFTAYAFYFPTGEMTPMYRAHASTLIRATKTPSVDPTDIDATITGTTVTLTPAFADNGASEATEVEWTARLGKVTKSGKATKNGSEWVSEPAKFDLLANATTYTIVFHGLFSGSAGAQQPAAQPEEGEEGSTVTPSAGYIDLLNTDVYYDAMTYGVTVLEAEKTRTTFTGIAYQTIGAHGETNHAMKECGKKGYAGFCRRRDGTSVSSTNIGAVTFNNGGTTVSTDTIGSSAGSANFTGSEVKVTGLQPSTGYRLYVYLRNCVDFEGKYDAVGYIDFTTEAVAIPGQFQARVTGTTITVTPNIIRWNNTSSLELTTMFSTVAGVDETGRPISGYDVDSGTCTVTPENLVQTICYNLDTGTKYLVTFTCEDDEGNEIEIDPIEVVTYGLELEAGISHTRTCEDCIIRYIEGERMSNTPQDTTRGAAVKWFITEATNSDNIIINPTYANCRRSNPYYFTTTPPILEPKKSYLLWAYIEGVLDLDSRPDTLVSVVIQCVDAAYYLSGETSATGTTISFTPTWINSESVGNVLTVVVGLYKEGVFIEQKQTTYKDIPVIFTGLDRGQYYTIVYTAYDNEGNTTNDYITYNPMYTGIIEELTYKLLFAAFETTTRSLFAVVTCNRTDLPIGTKVEYYIAQGNDIKVDFGEQSVNVLEGILYYRLIHNTQTTLGARFTTLKDQNDDYDTTEFINTRTKELTLEYQGYEASPHALATEWHALADDKVIIADQFFAYPIIFEYDKIEIVPVKRGEIGDDYGNYAYPAGTPAILRGFFKRYFDKLSAGREYKITMWVSDGVNEASVVGYATTLVPTIRIYSNKDHKWHKALPYIVHNSYWYPAPAYVYSNNNEDGTYRFMETNPTDSDTPDDDLFKDPLLGDMRNIPDWHK